VFEYTASDGAGGSDVARVEIQVLPINDAPIAVDDSAITDEDQSVEILALNNDSDPDGDELEIESVQQPTHGTVENLGNVLIYTPDTNFNGTDNFSYEAADGNGGASSAIVTVTVRRVNDEPLAQDDSAITNEDTLVAIPVLDNDLDPDGDFLIIEEASDPSNGSLLVSDTNITYIPDDGVSGIDSFTYTVSDNNGGTSTAEVVVSVLAVNDPPVAASDTSSTAEDTSVSIAVLDNDSDPDGDALTVQAFEQPSNGSVARDGDALLYTPAPDFNGEDSFDYTISDGNGETATTTVTISVDAVNDPPTAQDDSASTDEGTPITIGVLSNDTDPEGGALAIQSIGQAANGSIQNNGTDLTYTPEADFNGIDSFEYTITDNQGGTAIATVTVAVAAVNDPPVAVEDSASTQEDTSISISVLDNDSDPDGDALTVQAFEQPSNGSVARDGDALLYTPAPDFNGEDSFDYTISDGNGETATTTVTVSVDAVNDPPNAQDDSASTDEGTPITIAVLSNDTDPEGDTLAIQSIGQAANGSIQNSGTDLTYTPEADFNGIDSFEYTITDNQGGTAIATVTVAVAAVNDAPVATPDSVITEEDAAITIQALANDSDPDGDALVIQSVSQPEHGIVVSDGTEVIYTPDPDFNGIESFSYTISDGNGSIATATITVAVDAVNDPPVAQDDSAATDEDSPVSIAVLRNDTDVDEDMLTVQSLTQPTNGNASLNGEEIVYTPTAGFNGMDSFSYTVTDGEGGESSATVTVAVAAVNDPPAAVDDAATVQEDETVVISVLDNDSDPDGDTLAIQSLTQPSNGTATIDSGRIIYVPDPQFNGEDSLTYTITDGNGQVDQATVTITVAPVNDAPIAQDDTAATDEDQPVRISVLENDFDSDGDGLGISVLGQPSNGNATLDGDTVVYTPSPGFEGPDSLTYTLSDGQGGTSNATVTIFVAPRNDPPVAQADARTAVEDETINIDVLANDTDPDDDDLTVQSVTQPQHGAAIPSGTGIVYTPDRDYSGEDTFSYVVSDGNGGTAQTTVVVTILAANDAPIAQDDTDATFEDEAVVIAVLSNDVDPDADNLVIESVDQPTGGTVTNQGSELVYQPDPGFSGVDTFTYTVSDGNGRTDTARVTISVDAANDLPIAQDDSAATSEGTLVEIPVVSNDRDPDGDFLLVESFSEPENGSVLNSRTGISYIPDPGFQGTDSFEYTVADGNGGTDTATVTVAVADINDAPFAQDDSAVTDEGLVVLIPVLLNDSDPEDDALSIESVSAAVHGSTSIVGSEIEYMPDPGFSGLETFTYTASDGRGGTATATVFVAVADVNDAPVAQNDSAFTDQGILVTIPVLENDSDPDGDTLQITSITQPASGRVTIEGTQLVYAPDAGFLGNDSFTYTVADGNGEASQATVTIGVNPPIGGGGAEDEAACEGRVVISEIGWAGTAADPRDEWIELRNLGTSPVDLTGWVLRWRRTHPSSQEEQTWKFVELRGVLAGASEAACDQITDALPAVDFAQDSTSLGWLVTSPQQVSELGYYVMERRSDDTIGTLRADLVYDTTQSLQLELSDAGEVLMLINAAGEVVDTANASNLGRDGWVAGSAVTYSSMERIDPLAPDGADNWNTNLGVVIQGEDAQDHPLRATPGVQNSPELTKAVASLEPATVRSGEQLQVSFPLPRSARLKAGWPWISVSRPGIVGQAGAGGDVTAYSFSGSYASGDQYTLDVGTQMLAPGVHEFWIIYGDGQAVYLPIIIAH